jgi:hypothetical protein
LGFQLPSEILVSTLNSRNARYGCTAETRQQNTGRFIMFSVLTNIYNKKPKGIALMEFFTATGKLKFFFQLEIFDVCTTGDTAHIDNLHCCNDPCLGDRNLNIVSMCAVSPVVHTSNVSSCKKKLFQFSCGCERFH